MEEFIENIFKGAIIAIILFAVIKHFDNVETIKNNTSNCACNQSIEEVKNEK